MMTRDEINKEIIRIFCNDFQSFWLINIIDLSMEIFFNDEKKIIADSVDVVSLLNSYDKACVWYINNCVVDYQREKLIERTRIKNVLERTADGDPYFVEYGRINNGEINYNQLCYDTIRNADGRIEYVTLGFRDIDYRKKSELDDLTGVLTRACFFEKAEALMARYPDKEFDIVISDIVDFKKINEQYGIATADKILKWNGDYISQIMTDEILVGRYGGDQMVIFASREDILATSAIIGEGRYEKAQKLNGLPDVVIKFGVYSGIDHSRSIVSSCDKAHLALSSIKHHYSKQMAYYDEGFKEKLDKQRRIENSMHSSLENGDFKIYYQPKHSAMTGKLVGAEALIRWIHPEYGFMSPAEFIPLFEQNGFIVENDRFVWRQTCKNIRKWMDKGIKTVPISVNASKLTMSNIDIVSDMQVPLRENNVSPSQMHVEVTETLMTEDIDGLIKKLSDMREAGFEIELDDFGAGYSSVNTLSTFPLDIVKLDMSFMQQFGDEKRAKVLAACINLAKELGFKTVSEGVEHKEQNEVLGCLGVDMIQGYYYSKPLPEDEFEKYMVANL